MRRLGAAVLVLVASLTACSYEPPPPLTPWQLERLVAYAKLVGYLRHWHPSDQAAEADWEQLTVDGIEVVEECETPEELAEALQDYFQPVAPLVRLHLEDDKSHAHADLRELGGGQADPAGLTAWRHTGWGQHPDANVYGSRRLRKFKDSDELVNIPDELHREDRTLIEGLEACMPMALETNTETRETFPKPKGAYPKAKGRVAPDREYGGPRETWLAAVILGWNVMQHFYPYFDVVDADWDAALHTALAEMSEAGDKPEALRVLRRMVAQLHDGHGYAGSVDPLPEFVLPVLLDYVDGEIVVTWVHGVGKRYFAVGDVLMSIDGRTAAEWLAQAEREVSAATPQHRRHRALSNFAPRFNEEQRHVILERNGNVVDMEVDIVLNRSALQRREFSYDVVEEVDPNFWYVNLSEFDEAQYREHLDTLAQARGILFDLRGYPKPIATKLLGHLSDKVVQFPVWKIPVFWRPDQALVEFEERPRTQIMPQKPRFTSRVAFLVDGRAVSYAETIMGVVEHERLGAIVGEATAGTNGNVNPFYLPGGFRMAFTGMVTQKHDGSQHHGVGIQPTLAAQPTIAGVREGRDEVLEAALQLLIKQD